MRDRKKRGGKEKGRGIASLPFPLFSGEKNMAMRKEKGGKRNEENHLLFSKVRKEGDLIHPGIDKKKRGGSLSSPSEGRKKKKGGGTQITLYKGGKKKRSWFPNYSF